MPVEIPIETREESGHTSWLRYSPTCQQISKTIWTIYLLKPEGVLGT